MRTSLARACILLADDHNACKRKTNQTAQKESRQRACKVILQLLRYRNKSEQREYQHSKKYTQANLKRGQHIVIAGASLHTVHAGTPEPDDKYDGEEKCRYVIQQ